MTFIEVFPPKETILDNGSQLIDLYNTKILLEIEDVGGPFIMISYVSKDSLIQLVYNESKREVEFWNFEHFRLFNDYELKTEDRQRVARNKRWRLINTISVPEDFIAPFRAYNKAGIFLILSGDNRLYSVVNNELVFACNLNKKESPPPIILIDKETSSIFIGSADILESANKYLETTEIMKLLTPISIE
ncbi:MAG: hypothetical protein R2792_06640 [Saprospiraceae bacterium]